MYQIDTKVMKAITTATPLGKTHLAYVRETNVGAVEPRTFCGRKTFSKGCKVLTTVDVLGATMTPPCAVCLQLALVDSPDAIKEL